jgi:hypothetical protein
MLNEKIVPLTEAENEVKVVTQRLALLHLAYAKTIVKSFGWNKGKQLILDSIKKYSEYIAYRTKQGHQSLPKYGFWERRESKPKLCELGKIMLELKEPKLGSMYCLVDPGKTMAENPDKKLIHTRCMLLGHDECRFETLNTTDEEKQDFKESKDWTYVDPIIHRFLNKPSNSYTS